MECACTHHCGSIMCVSWAQARSFLQEDEPRLTASCLAMPCFASPRLVSRHRDLKTSCLEKKMEKGRRHTQKYFIAASVSVREGKNLDVAADFLRASSSKMIKRISVSVQLTFTQSHEVHLIEEFAYTKKMLF